MKGAPKKPHQQQQQRHQKQKQLRQKKRKKKHSKQHQFKQKQITPCLSLTKGSLVEVSTDEEGFSGAWYVATILHLPNSKKRNPKQPQQLFVEYQSLLSEDDSSRPLREYVNADFVRPAPPPLETNPTPFQLGDVVDAYYLDGWWTGVISKVVGQESESSKFVVSFRNPPDEIEFTASDLRFNHLWVNGTWLRPVNQRVAALMFSVGKRVELSFHPGDSQDIWYPATILEDEGNGLYLVEYKTQNGGGAEPYCLKATIDSLHIRPCPPQLKEKNFVLLEKVDAFYESSWWSGVITKELADSRYVVFFKNIRKEREFSHSELRPHMEWKGGKWFTSSQNVPVPSDYHSHEGSVCNNANFGGMAVPLGSSGSTKSTSEEKIPFSLNSGENQVELSTPCDDKFSPRDKPLDATNCEGKETSKDDILTAPPSITSTNTHIEEKLGSVASPNSESVGNSFPRQPLGENQSDNHSWGKRVKRKRTKFGEEEESPVLSSRKTNGSSMEIQAKSPQTSVGGLACDKMRSSGAKKSSRSNGEEPLKHRGDLAGLVETQLHTVKVSSQFELGERSQKKRRGRPPRSAVKSSSNSMSEELSRDAATGELLVKDCITDEYDSLAIVEVTTSMDVFGQDGGEKLTNDQIKQKNKSGSMNSMSSLKMPSEKVVEASIKQRGKHPPKRGRKRTINLNFISQDSPEETEGQMAESNSTIKELEMVTEESPNNIFDDQPLSKWLHAPAIDDSRVSPSRNVEQCAGASGEQLKIFKETPVDDRNKTGTSELQCFPFVKKSLLWSTIESMEVFQKMPQNPHFRPLEACKESSREGLAIGCMVNFTSVVERASKLKFDDPKSTIDDILETLMDLETHGFDVQAVRDYINHLLHMKEKKESLQSQVEKLNSDLVECNLENTKIDEEMDEINKQIKELQGKLSEAMSMKEAKNREITSLQLTLKGIKEDIRSVRCDFSKAGPLVYCEESDRNAS